MIIRTIIAASILLSTAACQKEIPPCDSTFAVMAVKELFYDFEVDKVRSPIRRDFTEDELKFDPFNINRITQNRRILLRTLNPSDMMVRDIKQIEVTKDKRTCIGILKAHARTEDFKAAWEITRAGDDFDVELKWR